MKGHFSGFRVIKSIENGKWYGDGPYNIESGVQIIEMVIHSPIPSYIKMDGSTSLVTYLNQVRTCMVCDAPGHVRKDCPEHPNNRIEEIRKPPKTTPEKETEGITYAQVLNSSERVREQAHSGTQDTTVGVQDSDDIEQPDESIAETQNDAWYNIMEAEPALSQRMEVLKPQASSSLSMGIETPCPNQQAEKNRRKRAKEVNKLSDSSSGEKKVPKLILKRNKDNEIHREGSDDDESPDSPY
ncbi:unnamed protein product [Phaedon cochleariae]|uniref:CCHC-type domain-containing protein n=1 Tax=Phaedon cochleariae TaxID=80249 RepID=A0A9N9SH04_PHACE|nr:unnamed protein product [Phaedon cochleariae]